MTKRSDSFMKRPILSFERWCSSILLSDSTNLAVLTIRQLSLKLFFMLFIIGMIGISSCTEQDLSTLKSPDAQVELRVADPPCYDAPYVPGFITITNRYLNAQGQCCITIQCNPPLTGSPGATYSACLSNTQSGAPLHPNLCVFFSAAGGTQTICYALTNFPLKITVTDESTGKIVNCDTYGKTCD